MLPKSISFTGLLDNEQLRMVELATNGFHCSEVLLFTGLEAQGKTNSDLIRAVSGLAGGMGFSGEVCGAFTGGVCLLGLYAGRGAVEESQDPQLNIMIHELVQWFSKKYGEAYGGILCRDITQDDPEIQPSRCPKIVGGVHKKVKSLLTEGGYHFNERKQPEKT